MNLKNLSIGESILISAPLANKHRLQAEASVSKIKDTDIQSAEDVLWGFYDGFNEEIQDRLKTLLRTSIAKGQYKQVPISTAKKWRFFPRHRVPKDPDATILVGKQGSFYVVLDGSNRLEHAIKSKKQFINALIIPIDWAEDIQDMSADGLAV